MPKDPKGPGCKKVANPCKICLQAVTAKNGVQCQGACEAWVHFECLNFTPGKIMDIKGGLITITCPCPDCKTTVPKEYRPDEPFACNNVMCPANNPPACEEFECQANELSRCMPPRCPPPGTLRSCGINLCRDYSGPNAFKAAATDPCMEGYTLRTYCGDAAGPPKMRVQGPDGKTSQRYNECNRYEDIADLGMGKHACKSSSPRPPAQDTSGPPTQGTGFSPDALQQMCKTVGDLTAQLNCLMETLKAMPGGGGAGGQGGMKACGSSGTNCGGKAGCAKCGKGGGAGGVVKKQGCTGGCGQAGQSGCAQPCHCPGNPIQKHR